MNNRDFLRLAPQATINSALRIDAEALSTDPVRFQKENVINYDLAINTWLLVIRDYAPYTWTSVATRIQKHGLADTVSYLKSAADSFIRTQSIPDCPLAVSIYGEISRTFGARNVLHTVYETSETPEGIFLFICRYLKRFTPLFADKLDTDAIQGFKKNQVRLKHLCRVGYSQFILDLCRDEIDDSLIESRCKAYAAIKMSEIEITPGVCYSLSGKRLRTLEEKQAALVAEYAFDSIDVQRRSVWDFILGRTARLMTVPKTFSAARTIAPEEVLRQAVAHRMFSLSLRELPGIDLTDQSVNQRYAKEGSITGEWCTIDLSHASDDVTWVLVQELYRDHPDYIGYLRRIRPEYLIVDQKEYLLQSFATMGNAMTFRTETEVFWTIARAAVHFAQRCGAICSDNVIVFGDDIICASEAYPFVVAFLSKLGFIINIDKSYAEGAFRESCGKDYLDGKDVSSPYFPRRPLKTLLEWYRDRNSQLVTTAESLISLQHRLFDVSPVAAQYIELYIREHKPDLGCELLGTLSTDLWGYDRVVASTRYIPEGEMKTVDESTVYNIGGTKIALVKKQRKLVRVTVKDDLHSVECQIRPFVSVDIGNHNDRLVYLEYLAQGPYYATPFDKALGISTSRYLIPTGGPRSAWKRFER